MRWLRERVNRVLARLIWRNLPPLRNILLARGTLKPMTREEWERATRHLAKPS